jgi:hypothetical protein
MIKYTANAFLVMKISFANGIVTICERVGADVHFKLISGGHKVGAVRPAALDESLAEADAGRSSGRRAVAPSPHRVNERCYDEAWFGFVARCYVRFGIYRFKCPFLCSQRFRSGRFSREIEAATHNFIAHVLVPVRTPGSEDGDRPFAGEMAILAPRSPYVRMRAFHFSVSSERQFYGIIGGFIDIVG